MNIRLGLRRVFDEEFAHEKLCVAIFSIFDGCERVKELENVLLRDETLSTFAINPLVYVFQKKKIPIEIKEVKWMYACVRVHFVSPTATSVFDYYS